MTGIRIALLGVVAMMAACAGEPDLTCDESAYMSTVRAPKVQAPDDLDDLEALREMPLPTASPQEARPAGGPCLDMPPEVIRLD